MKDGKLGPLWPPRLIDLGNTTAALVLLCHFQDLKQEIGLDHYEGRGWRGFHHHAALSIAAYGFLVAERSPIPPSAPIIRALGGKAGIEAEGYRPRGSAPAP